MAGAVDDKPANIGPSFEATPIHTRDETTRPALSPQERRSVGALSAIYTTRLLGLFLLLPVLALHARALPDYSPALLGLAMGAYGMTQAVLQIPFGRWSDRYGRKRVIAAGLIIFAFGSLVGAMAHSVMGLVLARALQGAGAMSAAVTALLADLTRAEVRTRAMAVVGISIGLSFVVALIVAPPLDAVIGMSGIFLVMLAMAGAGLALLAFAVPPEPARHGGGEARPLSQLVELFMRPSLRPLYAGIFALHFVMTSTFLAVPQVLRLELGFPTAGHWKVYLGVFVVSLVGTVPLILATERGSKGRRLFVVAVLLAAVAHAALAVDHHQRWAVLAALTLFFASFNFLEARLPALLTHAAPGSERGAALGIFATSQSLGAFLGGAVGGLLLGRFGLSGVFWGCSAVALGWAAVAAVPVGARGAIVDGRA